MVGPRSETGTRRALVPCGVGFAEGGTCCATAADGCSTADEAIRAREAQLDLKRSTFIVVLTLGGEERSGRPPQRRPARASRLRSPARSAARRILLRVIRRHAPRIARPPAP